MTEPARVFVIGGANADIKSRVDAPLVTGTSNPGATSVRAGGVARNVAESLARLGMRVNLLSAVGDDAFGRFVLAQATGAGIDTRRVLTVRGAATGTYNAILDADGGLVVGVSSMQVLEAITADVLHAHEADVRGASWLVLDANLALESLDVALDLAARHAVPVAIEPVSVAKAARLAPLLRRDRKVSLLTPNRDELAVLVGTIVDDSSLSRACEWLHERGVERVWVRLGVAGSFLSAADGTTTRVPTITADPVTDVTGAGDAALAGYLWAAIRGHDPATAARYGTAAALCTLRSNGSADDHLTPHVLDEIEQKLREIL